MENTEKILSRLKRLREESMLSQDSVASGLGINRSTYARKERGIVPITTGEWVNLAIILNVEINEFFTAHDNAKGNDCSKISFLPQPPPKDEEKVILSLYRSLDTDEKADFISTIRLLLKRITRKKVRKTLEELRN